jgi:hypothetical protein
MHKGDMTGDMDVATDMDMDADMTVMMMTAGKDVSAPEECMYVTGTTTTATAVKEWYTPGRLITRL